MKWKGYAWAALLIVLLCMAFSVLTSAESPSWWTTRGVLNTNWLVSDYAPVLAGQLKWMATNAAAELETLPGGAGTGVHGLVNGFTPSNNYVPINLGQLKNTAAPFYQRLMAVGYATNYPWTDPTADDSDFAPAVLGQLKHVFDFDVSTDSDDDDLPDWWEIHWFGSVTNWNGGDDPDGDGFLNVEEFWACLNPMLADQTPSTLPFVADFESPEGYETGLLDGQMGWSASEGVEVQSVLSMVGSNAVRSSVAGGSASHYFNSAASAVTNQFWLFFSDVGVFTSVTGDLPAAASSVLSYDPSRGVMLLDGNGSGSGSWVLATNTVFSGQWVCICIGLHYSTKTWDFTIYGVTSVVGLGFEDDSISALHGLHWSRGLSGTTCMDDVRVSGN